MDGFDFAGIMEPVARRILGEPNEALSSKDELRFGTNGSLSVMLAGDKRGTWYDHENQVGGGVLDLLRQHKRLVNGAALDWLRSEIGADLSDRRAGTADTLIRVERDRAAPAAPPASAPAAPPTGKAAPGRIVATYPYLDAAGVLLFEVVRYEPKTFRQRRPDGPGKWLWKMDGLQLVLYRLPEVAAAAAAGRTVYIAEGEKGADALVGLGLVATCSPGGAGKWRAGYCGALAGADVVVLPDNDDAGQKHAAMVAASLRGAFGDAARVRLLPLPDLPPKGDVADWIASGGTAAMLESMLHSTAQAPELPADDDHKARMAALVARFNKRYRVVNEGGKALIFQPGYDPALKRRHFDRMTVSDLRTLYMNERIQVGITEKGDPVMKPVADLWLRHPDRLQYIHGVVFDPTNARATAGVLNLWEGFATVPAKGNWSLMRSHIRDVICDGDPVRFNYLMGWMARMLQQPANQGEVAIVMKGGEGCGKGTVARALKQIIGHHALAIANGKHLVGNFNAHLRDVVFLFADEAFFAGDRAHVGVLKSIITEPYITVEAKHINAVEVPNYLHLMMASNETWVVPAALDSRRFLVLEVPERMVGNHRYFAEIWAQMEAGGYAAMLDDLLAYDLSAFNVRDVPVTEGLQRQRKLSLPTTEAWWQDCLARGYVFRSKLGLEADFGTWHAIISTELLFASYGEFAKSRGERHPDTREALGRFLVKMQAVAKRWRNGAVGEHITEEATNYGVARRAKVVRQERTSGYSFGSLADARAAFQDVTGLDVDWGDDADEPA